MKDFSNPLIYDNKDKEFGIILNSNVGEGWVVVFWSVSGMLTQPKQDFYSQRFQFYY